MAADGWGRFDLASQAGVESLAAELEASPMAGQLTLNDDPRWLATLLDRPEKRLRAYVCRERGRLVGHVAFIVRPDRLRATIGPLTMAARSVQTFESFAAPLVGDGAGVALAATARERLDGLFRHLRTELRPDDVLFLSVVAEGSVLHEVLEPAATRRNGFESVQHGQFHPHRTARVSGDFEAYLKSLGSRTRAELRATRKKFLAQDAGSVRTRCFRTQAEVPAFLEDAMQVSRKTWQYQHLNAGLRDAALLNWQFEATAKLGWFRSYVVYVGERPVAFQVGHVYRGVYYAQDTGYDPQWARLSAGIFQHTEILMDLGQDSGVRVFDFDRGDFSHKQRLATDSVALGSFHLIPATPGGRLFAVALRATGGVSHLLATWLDRLGVRDRSKRLSRVGLQGR